MNGFNLFLSLALFAQSTIAPLGSQAPSLPATDVSGHEVTKYGWQLNENNELEYLVQIAPDMLPFMNRATGQKEFVSEIPKQLVGRIHRVVVSIGTQPLPRTPSLQEIERMVPTVANLPPGRLRDLEPDAPVVVVNNGNTNPQFPEFPRSAGTTGAQNSEPPTAPLGSAFLGQARGNAADATGGGVRGGTVPSATGFPTANASLPAGSATGGAAATSSSTGRFAETAGDPATGGWQAQPGGALMGNSPNSSGRDPGQPWPGNQAQPAPGFGGNPPLATSGSPSGYPNGYEHYPANQASGPNYRQPGAGDMAQSPYPSQYGPAPSGYGQPSQFSTGQAGFAQPNPAFARSSAGFGDVPGRQGMSLADQLRAQDGWDGGPERGGHWRQDPEMLVASNRRELGNYPAAAAGRDEFRGASGNVASGGASRGESERLNSAATGGSDGSYHLFIFFVLSVAVNLWMVHLLRSLYLRYRNLLSSLRSQTA